MAGSHLDADSRSPEFQHRRVDWGVLILQLDGLSSRTTDQHGCDRQREIDASRHAATCDKTAVLYEPSLGWDSTEGGQQVMRFSPSDVEGCAPTHMGAGF